MITLKEACRRYTDNEVECAQKQRRDPFPIGAIRETEDGWIFYPEAKGMLVGIMMPFVNRHTGEMTAVDMFDYEKYPKVPVPATY